MSLKGELTDFLKEQIRIENQIVESLNSSLGEILQDPRTMENKIEKDRSTKYFNIILSFLSA